MASSSISVKELSLAIGEGCRVVRKGALVMELQGFLSFSLVIGPT